MDLLDVVRNLAEVHRKSVIYVPRDELTIGKSTPVLLVVTDETPFVLESKTAINRRLGGTCWKC